MDNVAFVSAVGLNVPIVRSEICGEHFDSVGCAIALESLGDEAATENFEPFVDFFFRVDALERTFRRRTDGASAFSADDSAPNEKVVKFVRSDLVFGLLDDLAVLCR